MAEGWNRPETGAWGWSHSGWRDNFYPDDLPDDWQLTYYSNEFSVAVIPQAYWDNSSREDLEQWAEGVHDQFRFIAELPVQPVDVDALIEQLSVLGGRLWFCLFDMTSAGGEVLSAFSDVLDKVEALAPVYIIPPAEGIAGDVQGILTGHDIQYCWQPGGVVLPAKGQQALIGIIESRTEAMPLPELRGLIEQFKTAATGMKDNILVFTGHPPNIEDMHNAAVIADLL